MLTLIILNLNWRADKIEHELNIEHYSVGRKKITNSYFLFETKTYEFKNNNLDNKTYKKN